jgi:hypothetical protein
MRIAVGTAWVMTGITFAAAAGITLTVAWFILDYFQDSKFEIRQQDEFALLVCVMPVITHAVPTAIRINFGGIHSVFLTFKAYWSSSAATLNGKLGFLVRHWLYKSLKYLQDYQSLKT